MDGILIVMVGEVDALLSAENLVRQERRHMRDAKLALLAFSVLAIVAGCSASDQALQNKCNNGDQAACGQLAQKQNQGQEAQGAQANTPAPERPSVAGGGGMPGGMP